MNRVIVPTNNASETKNLENLVNEITADDTPSRHPCKIRISPWRGKGHRFDPYQAKVISCTLDDLEDPEDADTSDEELLEAAHTDAFVEAAAEAAEQGLIHVAPAMAPNMYASSSYYAAAPAAAVEQPGLTPEPYFPDQPQQPVYTTPKAHPRSPWMNAGAASSTTPPPTYGRSSGTTSPVPLTSSTTSYDSVAQQQQPTYLGYTPQAVHQMDPSASATTAHRGYHTYTTSRARASSTTSGSEPGVSPPVTPHMGSKSGSFAGSSVATASTTTNSHVRSSRASSAGSVIKYAVIVFKHLKDTFFIPSTERQGLQVGDYVVVEGDRGENVGQLIEDVTPTHQRHDPIAGRVVRKATMADRRQWENARRREVEATALCQAFAEDYDVEMQVNDTEFQTDLNKLTVYYRTFDGAPVDFRQMQRALFKHYRCRIWLVDQTNTPTS